MKKTEFVKHFDKLRRCVDNQYVEKKKLLTFEFTAKMAKYLSDAVESKKLSESQKNELIEDFGKYANGQQIKGIRYAKA